MNHSFSSVMKRGAGCLILARKTGRLLMCKRSAQAPFPRCWATWGGKSEFDESPEETAVREVFEETGFRITSPIFHIFHFELSTFSFDTFLAIVEDEFEPYTNSEAEDSDWMALEEIPENIHDGLRAIMEDRMTVNRLIRYVESTSGRPCDFDAIYRG